MKLLLKWVAIVFQALLPAAMVASIGHLTTLPRSDWHCVEYSLAAMLIGLMAVFVTAVIWRVSEWLLNLAERRSTDNA